MPNLHTLLEIKKESIFQSSSRTKLFSPLKELFKKKKKNLFKTLSTPPPPLECQVLFEGPLRF